MTKHVEIKWENKWLVVRLPNGLRVKFLDYEEAMFYLAHLTD